MLNKKAAPLQRDSERFRMKLTNDRANIPLDADPTLDMRSTRELYEERMRQKRGNP